jgi:hypothetical protein
MPVIKAEVEHLFTCLVIYVLFLRSLEFFFAVLGFELSTSLAKEVLYYLRHTSSSFFALVILEIGSHLLPFLCALPPVWGSLPELTCWTHPTYQVPPDRTPWTPSARGAEW